MRENFLAFACHRCYETIMLIRVLLIIGILGVFAVRSAAQLKAVNPCVYLDIVSSRKQLEIGGTVTIEANIVAGPKGQKHRYKWTISDGTLVTGQGGPKIVVGAFGFRDQPLAPIEVSVTIDDHDSKCAESVKKIFPVFISAAKGAPCPQVVITGSERPIVGAGIYLLTASLSGGRLTENAVFNWSGKDGELVSGQWTPT
jgi:hypothetical protein